MVELYEKDYADQWERILAEIQLTILFDGGRCGAALGILGAPTSPLRGLLQTIDTTHNSCQDGGGTARRGGKHSTGSGRSSAQAAEHGQPGGGRYTRRAARIPGERALFSFAPISWPGRGGCTDRSCLEPHQPAPTAAAVSRKCRGRAQPIGRHRAIGPWRPG